MTYVDRNDQYQEPSGGTVQMFSVIRDNPNVPLENTIWSFSGDQRGLDPGISAGVIGTGSPVFRFLIQIRLTPSVLFSNAIMLPSGEKLAAPCDPGKVEME